MILSHRCDISISASSFRRKEKSWQFFWLCVCADDEMMHIYHFEPRKNSCASKIVHIIVECIKSVRFGFASFSISTTNVCAHEKLRSAQYSHLEIDLISFFYVCVVFGWVCSVCSLFIQDEFEFVEKLLVCLVVLVSLFCFNCFTIFLVKFLQLTAIYLIRDWEISC